MRICVLGIDGATRDLPGLMGIPAPSHALSSTLPPYTPPSWTTAITGVSPARHGIYGWQHVEQGRKNVRLNTSRDIRAPTLFALLGAAGLSSVAVNIPLTSPFDDLVQVDLSRTVLVSDWASPAQAIHPPKKADEYRDLLAEPPNRWAKSLPVSDYAAAIDEYLSERLPSLTGMLEDPGWDLFFIVFSEPDWLMHAIPGLLQGEGSGIAGPVFAKLRGFYETACRKSDIVIIISDHGFEPVHTILYPNEVLKRAGFIRHRSLSAGAIRHARKIIPGRILHPAARALGRRLNTPTSAIALETSLTSSSAFMVEASSWGLYVNRDMERVAALFHDTRGIAEVVRTAARDDTAPDLLLIPQSGVRFRKNFSHVLREQVQEADHAMEGVFSVTGTGVIGDVLPREPLQIADITPTILSLFSIPVPAWMEGRVLSEFFTPGTTGSGIAPAEDPSGVPALKGAVRNLGIRERGRIRQRRI